MSSDGKGTADPPTSKPGEGIRSIRTTNLFQIINFELYAKPVSWSIYFKLIFSQRVLTLTLH